MSGKFQALIEEIPILVGGEDNVEFFTHCVTRLRFTVVNKEKVDSEKIAQYWIVNTFLDNFYKDILYCTGVL